MDGSHYVYDAGGGHFKTVWNGQEVYDGTQAGAEQAYNQWDASESQTQAPAQTPAATPTATPTGAAAPATGKTIEQMRAELTGANYPGPWDDASVVAAYNRTAGGGGGAGAGAGGDTGYNQGAATLLGQLADQAGQRAYLNARLRELEIPQMQQQSAAQIEQLAQQAGRDAWNQKYQQLQLDIQRGTVDWQKEVAQAGLTGTFQGAPTQAAQAQQFEQALALGNQTGYVSPQATTTPGVNWAGASQRLVDAYNQGARGTGLWSATLGLPADQAQALAAASQEWTNAHGGQPAPDAVLRQLAAERGIGQSVTTPATGAPQATLAREQFEAQNRLNWAQLQSQQRGPSNAFAYLQTLRNTPESMRGIIDQALRGQGYGGIDQAARMGQPGVTPAGVPQPAAPQAAAPGEQLGPGTMSFQRRAMAGVGGDTGNEGTVTAYGGQPAGTTAGGLPLASQWNAKDFLQSSPYLRELQLAGYEANKQDRTQLLSDFEKSLPKHATAGGATYRQPTYG